MAEHRLDVPLLHQHAPLHHRRAGAELPHHVQVVGDEQHGDAGLPVQLFQKLQNLGLDGHVQGGGGLIQQQQLGPCHDGRGDHGPLQHPAGELVGILPIHARRVRQFHCCQGRQGLVPPRLPGEVCVDTQHLLHLGADTHQGVHAALRLLEHHADLPPLDLPQQRAVCVEQLRAVQQDLPGKVALLSGQQSRHAHGGDRLAGAGLAHQPQDLPVVDGQGHARHGLPLPGVEFHMQISDLQHQDTPPFRRCRPSPMRPTPKISSTMAPPEPRAYQGALVSIPCASESM